MVIVAGSDIWQNTPLPPIEASGTSGMKVALNGVLNLSTLDGWWLEGREDGVTGWGTGQDRMPEEHVQALYGILESTVLPPCFRNTSARIGMMKHAIAKIGPVFIAQRMMPACAREANGLLSQGGNSADQRRS